MPEPRLIWTAGIVLGVALGAAVVLAFDWFGWRAKRKAAEAREAEAEALRATYYTLVGGAIAASRVGMAKVKAITAAAERDRATTRDTLARAEAALVAARNYRGVAP